MAEEVLLLLVDDRTGRFLVDSTRLDNVLAGAVLVELVTIERVGFPPAGGGVKRGRMVVVDPTPLGDPVLDGALATVAAGRPAKPEQLIAKVRKRLRATLLERLTAAGALRRSTRKVLGIRGAPPGRRATPVISENFALGCRMCWWPEQHRTAAPLRSSASWWPSGPRPRSSTVIRRPSGPGPRISPPETGPAPR
jgi:hypothetical protein